MKKLLPCLLALLMVILFSCKKPAGFDYRDVKNFRISSWNFDKSIVAMDLVYFNPNIFSMNLRNVDCDIYLDNVYVGKFQLDTLMHISGKSEFTLPASMQVDMRNIFKNTLNAIFAQEVLVGVKGTTKVGKSGLFVTLPFNYEGRHKLDLFTP